MKHRIFRFSGAILLVGVLTLVPSLANASSPFIGPFNTENVIASTVPGNGDVNPYGVAVVQHSIGRLIQGNLLVSNFNDRANLQGTGTTIVQIAPNGEKQLFATLNTDSISRSPCPGGIGLTTALVVLREGWVIVGSLPTTDGTAATAKAGCLLVLNSQGRVVKTWSGPLINGPWDMTAFEGDGWAALFVTNVLNGTVAASPNIVKKGTVVRIDIATGSGQITEDSIGGLPRVLSETVIGSGFAERTDPAALVIGPTGVGLGRNGVLYVADTLSNRIAAIPNALYRTTSAGIGETVSVNKALNGPLGLAIAPDDDILVANANDGNIVETTPQGVQDAVKTVDTTGAGTLFGLAIAPNDKGVYFVDDGSNTLDLLH